MRTEGFLTIPGAIREGSPGEVLAKLRLELADEGRRREQRRLLMCPVPGLEGAGGVPPAWGHKQAAECPPSVAHFCPSFQWPPREGFPQKIPDPATVTSPHDLG